MKRRTILVIILIILFVAGFVWLISYYWGDINGALPAVTPPPSDITEQLQKGQNDTEFPLQVSDGFEISVFAKDLPNARDMVIDGRGNMWVSQTKEGTISLLETDDRGVISQNVIFRDLDNPHGLALDPQNPLKMYIAEEARISSIDLYTDAPLQQIAALPEGGRHFTRTLEFVDGRLWVSIGSSCDTCIEDHPYLATIISMEKDGSDQQIEARGLRNAVFMTMNPITGDVWATEMGRDHLGDNLPPDEINIIQSGVHYGWPYCYGDQVRDETFRPGDSFNCSDTVSPKVNILPAHSAPLGLDFVPEEGWPEEYWYDVIVAFHGSWNRTDPVGYKLYRYKYDDQGNLEGQEDFISGWLQGSRSLGRPVEVLIQPGGIMYVSDDKAGVIYEINYLGGDQE